MTSKYKYEFEQVASLANLLATAERLLLQFPDDDTVLMQRNQAAFMLHQAREKLPKTVVVCKHKIAGNWQSDSSYTYIGRGSIWGNPYSYMTGTKAEFMVKDRAAAIAAYREWITVGAGAHLLPLLHTLVGQKLVCYCSPKECHGDVLVELIHGKSTMVQAALF